MNWHSPELDALIATALAEDVGSGDATVAATIPPLAVGNARILGKQDLVCAGLPLAEKVFRALDPRVHIDFRAQDGQHLKKSADLLHLTGKASAILTGERVALNFLGRLCGIATLTNLFVQQLAGTRAKIRDTRKTTPGLRLLEKYAVKVGGGTNHRIGLYDAILLKENHIAVAGGVKAALDRAHAYASSKMNPDFTTAYEAAGSPPHSGLQSLSIQIEVRDQSDLREALSAGAASVLLDNMTPEQARQCVAIVRASRPSVVVEISGGITLQNARAYAETGADYLSSGALTHSAPNADLSLLMDSITVE